MRVLLILVALGAALAGADPAGAATTFTVNVETDGEDNNLADSTCDSDPAAGSQCSLRAAIQESNDTAGTDTIEFGIPGDQVHKIHPATALPTITQALTIDGYTQDNSVPNGLPLKNGTDAGIQVELRGPGAPLTISSFAGLKATAGPVIVRGLAINGFSSGILASSGSDVRVRGCFVGTDAVGKKAKGNGDGVFVDIGAAATIGGPDPADHNLISANADKGISSSVAITAQGNLIGVKFDGKSALGNADSGIAVFFGNSTIGGTGEAGNVIAFSGRKGVEVHNAMTNATIRGNRIFSNHGLAIDNGGFGRDQNDPLDADPGANGTQNFPVIKHASRTPFDQTRIRGVIKSKANSLYDLDFFSNPAGGDQAKKVLSFVNAVATDANGKGTFDILVSGALPVGRTVTATATDSTGKTSELSDPVAVERFAVS